MKPHDAAPDWFERLTERMLGRFFAAFNRAFERMGTVYARAVEWLLHRSFLGLGLYGLLVVLAVVGFRTIPTGFIPAQDKGYLITAIQLPDGASLERTDAVVRRAAEIILDTPGVAFAVCFAGFSGATRANSSNAGAIFVGPKPFEERLHGPSAPELMRTLQQRLSVIREAQIFVIPPPPVQGLGTSGGIKFLVQDRAGRGLRALQAATDEMVDQARKDPELAGVFTTFRASTPQIYANVDRVKAQKLGVPLGRVFDTLQVYLGSLYVNDLNLFGRTFQVRAQAESDFRAEPRDIERLKTRNAGGNMVPLGSVLDVAWQSGPDRVVRYNMFPGAEVQADAAPGGSMGTAMAAVRRLAEHLPLGFGVAWTDLAYQAELAGNAGLLIFPLCVLFVFLVHSAEYESWSLPLAIILIAPMCLPFALLGVWLRGMDNNLITQIGFVVLIGLAAKNAVLIVEFAKQQEDEGKDRFAAAIEAARLRLRPILMTSFAFILGVVPLARAHGPGAEMRQTLGTAVFSGMLGVTALGLFLTPVFFVVIRGFARRPSADGDDRGGRAVARPRPRSFGVHARRTRLPGAGPRHAGAVRRAGRRRTPATQSRSGGGRASTIRSSPRSSLARPSTTTTSRSRRPPSARRARSASRPCSTWRRPSRAAAATHRNASARTASAARAAARSAAAIAVSGSTTSASTPVGSSTSSGGCGARSRPGPPRWRRPRVGSTTCS